MPRVGLMRELKSAPSDSRIADLNESISAVTCGSVQIVDVVEGVMAVTPGTGVMGAGVTAPGVRVSGRVGCVPINNVGVVVTNGSEVGVAWAAGDAHAANRTSPIKNIKKVFAFILISSLDNYIPRPIYD